MAKFVVLGAGFGGKFFANWTGSPCLSRSNGFDLNSNLDGVLREIKAFHATHIFNFAAQSMVGESWLAPGDWMQTNAVAQTLLVQELAKLDFIERYFHFTTPEVYGSTSGWVTENWKFSPSTPYACSRAAGDWITKLWHDQYGFPAIFTRAANIYGEGQQLYRVIPKAVLFGLTGRKLPLHGGGKSLRSFVHMDDVCRALQLLVKRGVPGECYHVAPRTSVSIKELVECIEGLLQVDNLAEVSDDRPGKDQAYLLNSEKICDLGWVPRVELQEGLQRVIDWIKGDLPALSKENTSYVHSA